MTRTPTESQTAEPPSRSPPWPGLVGVLVIDDDTTLRRTLGRELRRRGFAVWAAADGAEAVAVFGQFRDVIAVVLSDVRMPVLDGLQTLDALRRIDPTVRVCFMTGNPADAIDRGAARVFPKPFTSVGEIADELRRVVAEPPADAAQTVAGQPAQNIQA